MVVEVVVVVSVAIVVVLAAVVSGVVVAAEVVVVVSVAAVVVVVVVDVVGMKGESDPNEEGHNPSLMSVMQAPLLQHMSFWHSPSVPPGHLLYGSLLHHPSPDPHHPYGEQHGAWGGQSPSS